MQIQIVRTQQSSVTYQWHCNNMRVIGPQLLVQKFRTSYSFNRYPALKHRALRRRTYKTNHIFCTVILTNPTCRSSALYNFNPFPLVPLICCQTGLLAPVLLLPNISLPMLLSKMMRIQASPNNLFPSFTKKSVYSSGASTIFP